DVADDGVNLGVGVAQLEEGNRDRIVHDLDHAAADELLVLHQGEVRLDTGGVAVHHEADGAGGGKHGDLGIAVAVAFAMGQRLIPAILAGGDKRGQLRGNERLGRVAV